MPCLKLERPRANVRAVAAAVVARPETRDLSKVRFELFLVSEL